VLSATSAASCSARIAAKPGSVPLTAATAATGKGERSNARRSRGGQCDRASDKFAAGGNQRRRSRVRLDDSRRRRSVTLMVRRPGRASHSPRLRLPTAGNRMLRRIVAVVNSQLKPLRAIDADLPRWLRHYNHERPHASFARQSPTAWLQAHPEQRLRKPQLVGKNSDRQSCHAKYAAPARRL
jgi:hypothetical protein